MKEVSLWNYLLFVGILCIINVEKGTALYLRCSILIRNRWGKHSMSNDNEVLLDKGKTK